MGSTTKSCDPGTFIFGAYIGPTWGFFSFSLLSFPTIKMYALHSFCTRYKLQLLCFSQWHCWPRRVKPRGAKLHFHCQFNHSESPLRKITPVAGPKQVGWMMIAGANQQRQSPISKTACLYFESKTRSLSGVAEL